MSKKNRGLLYEVHPTPVKGKDGKNIVYVRPAERHKVTMRELEEFCCQNYHSRFGELTSGMEYFLRAAGELMARGYRIETPIGSFAPKLKLTREVTDADEVKDRDVVFDGVDYNPGKLWNRELEKWSRGFCRSGNADTQKLMGDKERLAALMHRQTASVGYTTARHFAAVSELTYYSARKLLDEWCRGENPKLQKSRHGQEYIYTEV